MILRTRTQLIEDVAVRLRDAAHRRWSIEEIARALNDGLMHWGGRVQVEMVSALTLAPGQFVYALPAVTPLNVRVMARRNDGDEWWDLLSWEVRPTSSGGVELRLGTDPGTTMEAQVIWWGENGRLPEEEELPTLMEELSPSGLSYFVLDGEYGDLGPVGWAKIDDEWFCYAGVEAGDEETRLTILYRSKGVMHAYGAAVDFGVAMPDIRLLTQLYAAALGSLHALQLTEAPGQEAEQHQWQMRWWQQQADEFWQTWQPTRAPRMVLGRRALGPQVTL